MPYNYKETNGGNKYRIRKGVVEIIRVGDKKPSHWICRDYLIDEYLAYADKE